VDLGANLESMNMNLFRMNALLLMAVIIFQPKAFAQSDLPKNDASTQALVQLCQNVNDNDAQNFCFGFGEGVYQAYIASRNPKLKPVICFSSVTETREMILQEFLAWSLRNPQYKKELAAKTLVRFFESQYPCK
jgi:hypothetical protein